MNDIDLAIAIAKAKKAKGGQTDAMTAPPPQTNMVEQSMSGVNEGIGQMAGFPVDAVSGAINGVGQMLGRDKPLIENPVGGSKWFNDGMLNPTISDVEPQTRGQRIGRRVGEELGASAVAAPLGLASAAVRAAPKAFAATEAASALGSGTGAAVANEIAPGSAIADIVGALSGGIAGGGMAARQLGVNGTKANIRPGIEDQKLRANDAYGTVRADQRTMSPQSIDGMTDDIAASMQKERINPRLQPGSSAVLDALMTDSKGPMRIEDVENMRRLTEQGLPATASKSDQRLSGMMKGQITDYLDNLGDPIADNLKDGRNAHRRASAASSIDEASTKATRRAASTGSGGNEINAMRQNLRSILDNPRKARSFTKSEIELMDQVVQGTAGQNALRKLSRFAPTSGGLSAMMGIGGAMASPAIALPIMGATELAKMAGERSTRGAVDALMKSIAPDKVLSAGDSGIMPIIQALLAGRATAGATQDDRRTK